MVSSLASVSVLLPVLTWLGALGTFKIVILGVTHQRVQAEILPSAYLRPCCLHNELQF